MNKPKSNIEMLREAANRAKIAKAQYMDHAITVVDYDLAFRELNLLLSPENILDIFAVIDKQNADIQEAEKALLESDKVVKSAHDKFKSMGQQIDDLKEFIVNYCLMYTHDGKDLVDASGYMPGATKKEPGDGEQKV